MDELDSGLFRYIRQAALNSAKERPPRPPPPNFSNLTRSAVIAHLTLVVLLGLPGNILIVFATFKFKEFRSDRVSVIFIRYLGIIGCMLIVFLGIPAIVLFAKEWVFGLPGCYIFIYGEVLLGAAQFYVVLAITIHRLIRCTRPVYAGTLTETHAHFVIMVMAFISALEIPLLSFTLFNGQSTGEVKMDAKTIQDIGCAFVGFTGVCVVLQRLIDPIMPLISCVLINFLLWGFAISRSKFQIHLKPIITVSVLTLLLIACWVPPIIRFGLSPEFKHHVLILDDYPFFIRMGSALIIPIVFVVFNKPFAEFIKCSVKEFYRKFVRKASRI